MTNIGLVEILILLLGFGSVIVGVMVLARRNAAARARTQAYFGAPGAGAGPEAGMAPVAAPAVVVAKRTYQWPDRVGYYVTFQLGSGAAPPEVEVTPEWYAHLNPGDRGELTLYGSQFDQFKA